MTENPKERVANGCAISTFPVFEEEVAGLGELGECLLMVLRGEVEAGGEFVVAGGRRLGGAGVNGVAYAFCDVRGRHR